jgi:anti-sigma regulatory factor (Ser/Thr protein kinase)
MTDNKSDTTIDTLIEHSYEVSGKTHDLELDAPIRRTSIYTIKSNLKDADVVLKKIEREFRKYGISVDKGIIDVLSEAINNSIRHGYKNDPNRIVDVECHYTDSYVTVVVHSEGSIDVGKVLQKIAINRNPAQEDLLATNGRGFFLMSTLFDQVYIRNNDTKSQTILMKKYDE